MHREHQNLRPKNWATFLGRQTYGRRHTPKDHCRKLVDMAKTFGDPICYHQVPFLSCHRYYQVGCGDVYLAWMNQLPTGKRHCSSMLPSRRRLSLVASSYFENCLLASWVVAIAERHGHQSAIIYWLFRFCQVAKWRNTVSFPICDTSLLYPPDVATVVWTWKFPNLNSNIMCFSKELGTIIRPAVETESRICDGLFLHLPVTVHRLWRARRLFCRLSSWMSRRHAKVLPPSRSEMGCSGSKSNPQQWRSEKHIHRKLHFCFPKKLHTIHSTSNTIFYSSNSSLVGKNFNKPRRPIFFNWRKWQNRRIH